MRALILPLLLTVGGSSLGQRIERFVFDTEGILAPTEVDALNQIFRNHEHRTSNEIAVVTTATTKGKSMAQWTADWGDRRGVGKKGKNNGVVIAISKEQREVFIATGTGMEIMLPDKECKRIIDAVMLPRFREDRYYQGLFDGGSAIVAFLEKSLESTTTLAVRPHIEFSKRPNATSPTRVAITSMSGTGCGHGQTKGEALTEMLSVHLGALYTVVERDRLDAVLKEAHLGMSGILDEKTAATVGSLTGADGMVLSTQSCLDGKELFSIRLIDCSTGQQVWAATGSNLSYSEFLAELDNRLGARR
jgi:uncharacterized membrane protein YgcG